MAQKLMELVPVCFGCRKRVYKGAVYCARCQREKDDNPTPVDPSWAGLEARSKHYWTKVRRDSDAMERHREMSREGMQELYARRKAEGLTVRGTPRKRKKAQDGKRAAT